MPMRGGREGISFLKKRKLGGERIGSKESLGKKKETGLALMMQKGRCRVRGEKRSIFLKGERGKLAHLSKKRKRVYTGDRERSKCLVSAEEGLKKKKDRILISRRGEGKPCG